MKILPGIPVLHGAMPYRIKEEADFNNGTGADQGVVVIPFGAGAGILSSALIDKSDHPGLWRASKGTTATGRLFIISSSPNGFHIGRGGRTRIGTVLKTGPILAALGDDYTLRSGMFSIGVPNFIIFGVGFEYDRTVFGGNWQIVAVNAGQTSLDSLVAVVADTWYELEIEVNEDASSIEYFIDGNSVGTIAVAANIPSGIVLDNFYNSHIYSDTGVVSREVIFDNYYFRQGVRR